jgi:myo-inositol-hexaphosphate 3-phosphohydrolase
LTTAGEFLNSWAFPGDNQEGMAVDEEGFLYIAQDSGGIIKTKWDRQQ